MLSSMTWNDLERLRRQMDRLFDGYLTGGVPRRWSTAFLPGRSTRSYPLINMKDESDAVVLEALAPGIDPEKLEVTVQNDQLTIAGEKSPLEDVKPEQYHRSERSAGKFVRQVTLPYNIDDSKVEATYRNGLLHIRLPKSEEAKPRQISVQSE